MDYKFLIHLRNACEIWSFFWLSLLSLVWWFSGHRFLFGFLAFIIYPNVDCRKSSTRNTYLSIYEGRLFVLFWSYEIHWTGICFRSCSWCLWKALGGWGGVHGLGMTIGLAVQKLLNIERFFHWKLNLI